jgi:predicted GH43/DUF377 family glycosyl hydrolase
MFDFGKQEGYSFFNCALVERPDGLWLIPRRSKNERRFRVGFNDLVAARLDENTYKIQGFIPVLTKHHFDREHFEDPRAIYHNGITYISACNFVIVNHGAGWTGAHQTLNLVASTHQTRQWKVDLRIDPIFGYNGERIGKDAGMEKNWLWFFHENRLHMVYKAEPHVVAEFDSQCKFVREHKTGEDGKLKWEWGIIRGGTPPVRVGNEYLTFFHSSLSTGDQYHRRYYMGAYTFEAQEPFRITRITPEPLLAGSWQDRWAKNKPLVVFPCGSRLKNNTWLVTMGVNDLDCAWMEIPHPDLEERLQSLTPKKSIISGLIDVVAKRVYQYSHA